MSNSVHVFYTIPTHAGNIGAVKEIYVRDNETISDAFTRYGGDAGAIVAAIVGGSLRLGADNAMMNSSNYSRKLGFSCVNIFSP